MSEKPKSINRATDDQILEINRDKTPQIQKIYLAAHRLILDTLPDVVYETDVKDGMTSYGVRQYGYDGWGMAALSAHSKWVNLHFMRGVELQDPDGLLEGAGKKMRHVKLRSTEQFGKHADALRRIIVEASILNQANS